MHREQAPDDLVAQAVASASAVALVPGAEEGSISLVRSRRHVVSAAVTSDVARAFDALQETVGEGPCLAAMFSEAVVRTDDLAEDTRWPSLGARTDELGVRRMLCFQLFVHENTLGALNLLSSKPAASDDEAEGVGTMVATQAAVVLTDRDVIGQAKGILMERFTIGADRAFALLTRASQDRNVELHQLATELTRTVLSNGDVDAGVVAASWADARVVANGPTVEDMDESTPQANPGQDNPGSEEAAESPALDGYGNDTGFAEEAEQTEQVEHDGEHEESDAPE